VLPILVMSILLVWRHRRNIGNLLAGKESRIGARSAAGAGASAPAKGRRGGHRRII
jgi:glycerol-3-phosphate acyltransferase PlsY